VRSPKEKPDLKAGLSGEMLLAFPGLHDPLLVPTKRTFNRGKDAIQRDHQETPSRLCPLSPFTAVDACAGPH